MINHATIANSPETFEMSLQDEIETQGITYHYRKMKTDQKPDKQVSAISDNPLHRALFSLPPLRQSEQTLPAATVLPMKKRVTGDKEVDAVLWLREVIGTGDAALIAQAQEAAKKIRTPLDELEKRYREHLQVTNPGNMFAALSSFGFADLDALAKRAIERRAYQVEALGRFGSVDALVSNQPSEAFCVAALAGLERDSTDFFDNYEAAGRFKAYPAEMPRTLSDCLHELKYWNQLYQFRHATTDYGDSMSEASAREWFVFGLLAEIRPRDRDEARAAFHYLFDSGRDNQSEARAILANLIG